jgi:hypothetical protein
VIVCTATATAGEATLFPDRRSSGIGRLGAAKILDREQTGTEGCRDQDRNSAKKIT